MRRFGLVFILVCALLQANLFAQREIQLQRIINVDCPNQAYHIEQCDYSLLIPANRPGRQEIVEYKYPGIKPTNVLKNEVGEYYLQWKKLTFGRLKDSALAVTMKVKLYRYDLKTARKRPFKIKTDLDTALYLSAEENFRSDAKSILEVANKIEGSTREEITKNIFEFVVKTLDYKIYFFQDRGARQALKDGKGDCTEYSELMVTLCRAKEIPARIVMGLIPASNGAIGYHNWVEVFFPQYGWVAFDPTFADHPLASTTFYSMKNTYVELSTRRYVQTFYHSCTEATWPFSITLKDTSEEISSGVGLTYKTMRKLYDSLKNKEALPLADSLCSYEPDNYAFRLLRGILLARLGKFDSAKNSLKYASLIVESNVDNLQCYYAWLN